MSEPNTLVWRDITVFDGIRTRPEPMAVVVRAGRIETLCPMSQFAGAPDGDTQDMGSGGVMTPGLTECHTHLVFGGHRADEFERRLEGNSYQDIARAGGGIPSTVRATRAASEDELFASASGRLQALMADGVTTVEIKSGYGLSVEDELKMLRVARRLGEQWPVRVFTTFLGAHALPAEYKDNGDGYIALVCEEMLPAAAQAGLVDAVDVFCENIAFSVAQCERVFAAARRHDLPVKAHAGQLSNIGATAAAARFGALSADHLEHLDEAGVRAMQKAGTTAVLLPGAFHTLRETQMPPIQLLRDYGVPIALASDGNPGTSPLFQPTLTLNFGCTLFRLTPSETLAGLTANAARALGAPELGRIEPGAPADLAVWNVEQPAELAYAIQAGRLRQRIFQGAVANMQPSW